MACSKPYCKNDQVPGKKCCSVCVERSKGYARRHREAMRRPTTKCECGGAKSMNEEACSVCYEMDGKGAVGALVSALRVLGGSATLAALIEEMGIASRNVYRAIAIARGEGRVRQVQQWEDLIDIQHNGSLEKARRPKTAYQENHGRSSYGARFGQAPCLFVLLDKKVAV